MANVKKGDKVRFLNMEGGGIITRIEGRTVYVEEDDGFEYPVTDNEVVLIEAGAEQKKQAEQRAAEQKRTEVPEIMPTTSTDDYTYSETQADDANPQFFVAFLKSDNGNSGFVDLYIVNDSNSFVFFSISEHVGNTTDVRMLHYGTIEPNTKLMLDKYNPQRIDNQTWTVQLVLYKKNGQYKPLSPVETELKIKSARFFKDNAFAPNNYFAERAVLYSVIATELQSKIDQLTIADLHKIMADKERAERQHTSKANAKPGEIIEVDLHINAIIDNTTGLSNSEMLQLQIARFNHVMTENASNKGQRIVFIHGVGNGTLKNEVRKLLDRNYRKCYYQDASFKEYGYGATMVVIG